MAKRTVLVDDMDGKVIEEGDGETIRLTYRGQTYELDLNNKNLEGLDKALQKYLDKGTRVVGTGSGSRRGPGRSSRASNAPDTKAVREWAQASGIEVSSRGRIAAGVMEQYEASNG